MYRKPLIAIITCVLTATCLAVPTVTVSRQAGYYDPTIGTGRGEFTLTPSADWSGVLSLYDAQARGVDSFQSFCMEAYEHVVSGETYNVVFNDKAIDGGVGPAGDPLSIGTAFLYHEFQSGTLENYDYTPGAGRIDSARELQYTIWWLEGEVAAEPANDFTTLAKAMFVDPMMDNNGAYSVAILNLYDAQGNKIQDMLVCIPAPGAILLGSIGVGFVGWLRRRKMV